MQLTQVLLNLYGLQKQKQALGKYNHLVFSDGSEINTVNQHRIFNVEKGMFTYPMTETLRLELQLLTTKANI